MKARLLLAALRMNAGAQRQLSRLEAALSGFALAALTPRQLDQLTARIYSARRAPARAALFGWERAWLERALPAAPARVLLGGAGDGPEAPWLLERGYEVLAFDPAEGLAARAEARLSGLLGFEVGGYEALLEPSSGLSQATRGVAPFDAVVLGWGSFTHVSARRAEILARLAALCPEGPILLSFWMRDAALDCRARRLGWRLGGGREAPPEGDVVRAHCGYGHQFSEIELGGLAAHVGRRLILKRAPHPHATLER